jgi:acetyl-CoA decarbonylase/synthase complex subunit delta
VDGVAFEVPKLKYTGKIRQIVIGKEGKTVTVGGESAYPFYTFEGEIPNRPKIAMEVYDIAPEEWAPAALEPFKDVVNDPVAWAKLCVEKHGAEIIALQLASTDPNGVNRSADEAARTVKNVVAAVNVPVIVIGTNSAEKDLEVLRKVAEVCDGQNITIGPVQEANHKQVGASCIGYKQTVIASTPIDINLAKQLNIQLGNLGVPDDRLLLDPTTGGLGYGLEYTYSVMERDRMAALMQQDEKLQCPIICDMAKEIWKTKEAKTGADDPRMGDPAKRGILMESVMAVSLLIAGADILVMRHPEAIRLVRGFMDALLAA